MSSRKSISFPVLMLAAGLLMLGAGCGKDIVIDVNALPCGTAAGTAASGSFAFSGEAAENDCAGIAAYDLYKLLEFDTGITVNHYQPGQAGCEIGRMEILFPASSGVQAFTLKGGLWSDGSFRVGQAVSVGTNTFRILMDGKFMAEAKGQSPQNHFEGLARIDISSGETECTYEADFTATRTSR